MGVQPQLAELLAFFAEDFDSAEPAADRKQVGEAAPEPAVNIEAVRDAAYQEGLRDGFERAVKERNHAVEQVLGTLETQLAEAQYRAAQEVDRATRSVARLLIQALLKVLPAACARYGAREVAEIARAVLPGLRQEPRVELAVHPSVAAEVEAELARIGAEFRQRAVVTPTDGVVPGDVRITWQDGSATRDSGELIERVAAVFAEFGLLEPALRDNALAAA